MAPNVTLSFGPMLIGTFINMILYGVLIVQTYHYYLNYKHDARWIKALVYYLFLVESLNTAFDIQMMYQPLIQHFGGGIWTTALIVKVKVFARKAELHWSALVWFLAACISDVLITMVLVVTLSKRKTGFAATDDAIQRIIRITVQTGALTAFFAIGDVVFFMTMGHTALNFLWDLALSKLYANCLLSTLNARTSIKEGVGNSNSRASREAGRQGGGGGTLSGGRRAVADPFGPPSMRASYEYDVELAGSTTGSTNCHHHHHHHNLTHAELGGNGCGGGRHHRNSGSRSFGIGEKASFSRTGDAAGLEYGITVTKVVETLEDPCPIPPLPRYQLQPPETHPHPQPLPQSHPQLHPQPQQHPHPYSLPQLFPQQEQTRGPNQQQQQQAQGRLGQDQQRQQQQQQQQLHPFPSSGGDQGSPMQFGVAQ
ncbi:hypothetical protein CC1G_10598 [Coprinopsis cinerea okayama7|uniref:DUF6534 domain-containing protein n=1 Tax=Coprinopsis cinerea (strain Okayama-7 / 130 / ATCC MYA-4618 / FGSC 9003) TaxID=240176 RepID=A8P8N4_COPC7|nr:hypothetical protein CC1G_10598 [Coprinopsis cinerea okayama7\|eukprot:XP_001839605.2 hypothetical protein CC1G_10598 [Coprinopsis cinerea okayama7\